MGQGSAIAKRLKEARLRAGLSQKRLGVLAGIDESSASPRINQYEKGKHIPHPTVVRTLARVLRAPTAYFYAEDDTLAALILAVDRTVREREAKTAPRPDAKNPIEVTLRSEA